MNFHYRKHKKKNNYFELIDKFYFLFSFVYRRQNRRAKNRERRNQIKTKRYKYKESAMGAKSRTISTKIQAKKKWNKKFFFVRNEDKTGEKTK